MIPRNLVERTDLNEKYRIAKYKYRKLGYVFQLSFYGEYATATESKPRRVEVLSRHPYTNEQIGFITYVVRKAPPPHRLTLMLFDPPAKLSIVYYGD